MRNLKLTVLKRLLHTGKPCTTVVSQLTEDSTGSKICRTRDHRIIMALEGGFLGRYRHKIAYLVKIRCYCRL
jgi:hypothetical protein